MASKGIVIRLQTGYYTVPEFANVNGTPSTNSTGQKGGRIRVGAGRHGNRVSTTAIADTVNSVVSASINGGGGQIGHCPAAINAVIGGGSHSSTAIVESETTTKRKARIAVPAYEAI